MSYGGGRFTLLATVLLMASWPGFTQTAPPKPYGAPLDKPLEYNGPGREDPEPGSVKEVRIGYFGPSDVAHAEGGQMWAGASLAIDELNAGGGYRGLPFRLISAWADDPWRGGVARLARVTYADQVWALIGGIDGATTHLAEQLVPKALLALVNPAATDRSVHAAGVPWVFTCVPGDQTIAAAIAGHLKRDGSSFALISAIDHDSRAFVAQLKTALAREHMGPALHLEWDGREEGLARIAAQNSASTVVVIAGAKGSVALVRALRASGFAGAVLGGPWIGLATARDPALKGVLYPVVGSIAPEFRARFAARYGRDPDYAAAHAYDAVTLVAAAVKKAGLNRARIRDEIRALAPYRGVTGPIEWDTAGQNNRPVTLLPMP